MNRSRHLLVLTAAALLLPVGVLAAPPGDVRDLTGVVEAGQIRLQWTPPLQGEISKYHVYLSSTSIIEEAGTYDRMEETPGAVTTYLLAPLPGFTRQYILVLGVSPQGEENVSFSQELVVDMAATPAASLPSQSGTPGFPGTPGSPGLPGTPGSPGSPVMPTAQPVPGSVPPMPPTMPTDTTTKPAAPTPPRLQLLSAQAVSATGILLTFSADIIMPPGMDSRIPFTVRDASGTILALSGARIEANTVLLITAPQKPALPYRIEIKPPIGGLTADRVPLPLDPLASIALSVGFSPSAAPSSTPPTKSSVPEQPASEPKPVPEENALHVQLLAKAEGEGLYTVSVTWDPTDAARIQSFSLDRWSSTLDTDEEPRSLNASVRQALLTNTPAGRLEVNLQALDANGDVIMEETQSLELAGKPPANLPAPTAAVTSSGTKPGDLPRSGPAALLLAPLIGAAVGWNATRRWSTKKK